MFYFNLFEFYFQVFRFIFKFLGGLFLFVFLGFIFICFFEFYLQFLALFFNFFLFYLHLFFSFIYKLFFSFNRYFPNTSLARTKTTKIFKGAGIGLGGVLLVCIPLRMSKASVLNGVCYPRGRGHCGGG